MRDYLIFHLYGPLAAWGDIAVGEYRPSFTHPSKSAIVGLLAAALGIRRGDDALQRELDGAVLFAVRMDTAGSPLRDFHTIQTPGAKTGKVHYTRSSELKAETIHTILSTRDYYCDACYTVAINVRDNSSFSIERFADALLRPVFTLYLGRKSCPPSLPLHPRIIKAASLRDALEKAPFPMEVLSGIGGLVDIIGIYWEDGVDSGYKAEHSTRRRDVPISRRRWQFNDRYERYASVRREV